MTAAVGSAKLEAHTPLGAMSEEQLKAFMEAVKADAGLQEKLKAAADYDAVMAIAKLAGFMISADELQQRVRGGGLGGGEWERNLRRGA